MKTIITITTMVIIKVSAGKRRKGRENWRTLNVMSLKKIHLGLNELFLTERTVSPLQIVMGEKEREIASK